MAPSDAGSEVSYLFIGDKNMFGGLKITKLHLQGEGESKCEIFSVLFQRTTSSCNGMAQWYLSCYRDCYEYFTSEDI